MYIKWKMFDKLTGFNQLLRRIFISENIRDIELQRRMLLLNIIFIVGIAFLLPYSIIAYVQGNFWLSVFDMAVVFVLVINFFYLRRSQNLEVAAYFSISIFSALLFYVTATGGVSNTGPLWSYTLPLFTLFLLGAKKGSLIVSIYFFFILLILFFPGTPLLFTDYGMDFRTRYVTTFAATYVLAFIAEWVRTKTQEKISQKTKELENTLKELREAEAERIRLQDELLAAKKMEAVGTLAGGIAHDFNNLLSIIMGSVSVAKDSEFDTDIRTKMLEKAETASLQAAELSQKLITFSRGGWIVRKKIFLPTLLKDFADNFPHMQPLLRDVSIPPDLKPINGDEGQLRQVLLNLLQNADEAMSEPKRLAITAKNIIVDEDNDFLLKAGKYVRISIKDNGVGIPPANMENIFNPYFSTKETFSQKGMGLGLAICYSIIKRHQGHIDIESEVGKGTTANIYIPTYTEKEELTVSS